MTNFVRHAPRAVLALFSVLLLSSCGGESGGGGPGEPVPTPTTLAIGAAATTLRIGQARALTAVVLDQSGDTMPDEVITWSSLAPDTATVDGTGLVQSILVGTARVLATSGALADTVLLSVTLMPVTTVVATADDDTLLIEDSTALHVATYDSTGALVADRPITWASVTPGAAVFLPGGKVQIFDHGPVRITATSEGRSDTVTVTGRLQLSKLFVGYDGACGLTPGGLPFCWGYNSVGQVGGGPGPDPGSPTMVPSPRLVPGGQRFVTMDLAEYTGTTCGLTAAGAAWCWGINVLGQLGVGATDEGSSAPQEVIGGHTFVRLESGYTSRCGLATDDRIWCWGGRTYGSWGDSLASGISPTPVLAAGGRHFSLFTMAWRQSCGVSVEDGYVCWGQNRSGSFGSGDTTSALTPRSIDPGLTFTSLRGEFDNMCGVAGGVLHCWGFNLGGQVGDGTTDERWTPTAVSGGLSFAAAPASLPPDCAITDGGAGYCWGHPGPGAPTAVPLAGGWKTLERGDQFTCGLGNDGIAYCWGINLNGRLGVGSLDPVLTLSGPTPVAGQ